jgi:hypothetical protein
MSQAVSVVVGPFGQPSRARRLTHALSVQNRNNSRFFDMAQTAYDICANNGLMSHRLIVVLNILLVAVVVWVLFSVGGGPLR